MAETERNRLQNSRSFAIGVLVLYFGLGGRRGEENV